MGVDLKLVKKLRESSGIGMLECKKAIEESNNNYDKAVEILRKKGYEKAKSKSSRTTNQGIIGSYIHSNLKIGVLIELACETDFVSKNEDFLQLSKDISMQIAAMTPKYIKKEDVPQELIEKEKDIFREQMKNSGKPDNIIDKIVEGKLGKFYSEICLLNQSFFKDDKKTMEELIAEKIHKIGENIVVKRFVRFQLGEEA
jgi:elongation factor Ts